MVNAKRTYRLYCEEGLQVRRRKRKRRWSLDFLSDGLWNGRRFRDECLNENWFASIHEARQTIEAWWRRYNTVRPRLALDYETPAAFAEQFHRRGHDLQSHSAPCGPVPIVAKVLTKPLTL